MHRDVFEGKRHGLVFDSHRDFIIELNREPVGLQFLDKSDHKSHVHILEDDMRSANFLSILHFESCAHRVARRHDHGCELLNVEGHVHVCQAVLEEDVDALIYDGKDRVDDFLVEYYQLV